MIKNPKVSICIPTYNNPTGLDRLLKSISLQSFNDYEVIVTDDSTNSEVKEVCRKYKGVNLNYIKNRSKLGSPNNWNAAMLASAGEYVKIMHHDDYFSRNDSLEKFVEQGEGMDIVFSSSDAVGTNGKLISVNSLTEKNTYTIASEPALLFFGNSFGAPSACMVKRGKYMPLFDPNFIWLVDVDYYIALLTNGYRIGAIKAVLVTTTQGSVGQITQEVQANRDLVLRENIRLCTKYYVHLLLQRKYRTKIIKYLAGFSRHELAEYRFELTRLRLWNGVVYAKAINKVFPKQST